MNIYEWIQILLFFIVLVGCTPLVGHYVAGVAQGERTLLSPLLRPIEAAFYRLAAIDATATMTWKSYLWALLTFNLAGFLLLILLQLFQGVLPFNPQYLPAVELWLAFNSAVSFVTNTNWQSYAGETTMSYLTQMLGLTVQNFVSAATGIAVLFALARALARRTDKGLGNFWVDMTRTTLYVLLPLSLIFALVLVSQGVVQTNSAAVTVQTLNGEEQLIALGPAASQVAIKQLGTNGGGFFNANSTHPLENPTPLSNFLQLFAILLLPAALTYTFGQLVGAPRHGWVLFCVMLVLLSIGLTGMIVAETAANPLAYIAMEGKETRFGVVNSLLWAEATTAASNGSVNAMHSSLSPLAGLIAMLNIMLGEVIFGGVGAGLYGMVIFVILTVFIAGLMVGRTPEYLGKKIEAWEIQMAVIAILLPNACILIGSALAVNSEWGLNSRLNAGPHGLSEILYAFSSAAGNNGSAFAGLNANTPFYNIALGLIMLIGRYGVIIPVLAIAGTMVHKRLTPPSPGTFPTEGWLFGGLLAAVILIVGALSFFPVLSLGPLIEHFLRNSGQTF